MEKTFEALGHQLRIEPSRERSMEEKTKVKKGIDILKGYQAAKAEIEANIVENEEWFKSQHWDIIRQKKEDDQEPEPVTAYLFSVLSNKHADAMDNYPSPNIMEREESDQPTATELSEVLPVILERNEFEETWDRGWWYKLKQGFTFYGTFWDSTIDNGLGDIQIKKIDALNVYWEPGITKIQDSRNIFITKLVDKDIIEKQYPELKGKLRQDAQLKPKEYETYKTSDNLEGKVVLVDWYTKENGRLDLCKFVDGYILEDTAENEKYPDGLYKHGKYPIFCDVLFPMEGTPIGFGFIDIVRSPQAYIDKLDQIISKNALVSGKQRWLVSRDTGINMEQLKDLSVDFIECEGRIDESKLREMQADALKPFIVNHRDSKIQELKEISADNQFSRGEGGGGVTAASAIQALQEASTKVARDMIKGSYRTYRNIIRLSIELISEFYDTKRKFRITKPNGEVKYTKFDNSNLKPQPLDPAFEGENMIQDPESGEMIEDPDYQAPTRKPIFDIKVRPEKDNPFNRAAMNEFAKELYNMGFFDPQRVDQALMALDLMHFEGKEQLMQKISKNGTLFDQMQKMKKTMDKMAVIIDKQDPSVNLTGQGGMANGSNRNQ